MRQASVYLRAKQYLVHASSITTDGLWILAQPCLGIPSTSSDRELGEAIQQALQGSQTGIPHPRNFTGLFDPILALAGVKSWSTFVKGASTVRVESNASRITVTPYRNLGAKDGFVEDLTRNVVLQPSSGDILESVSADAIGGAVRGLLTPS